MSRHWNSSSEDSSRLPYGMRRTAYDADTEQYTFFDSISKTDYVSAPGEAYGTLLPAATGFPKTIRTTGRKFTLQHDRPVFFADDTGGSSQSLMGHKRAPTMPVTSSRHHSSSTSGSTRKKGRSRSASFSDFVPAHLIARASNSPDVPTATSKQSSTGARGGAIKSAPPSPSPSGPLPQYSDEKKRKPAEWRSSSPTDPLASLPTLSGSPPPLPPKDYFPSSRTQREQQQGGETRSPRVAMRLTARVLGRTLGAVKAGQRSPKGQGADDEWVVV